MLVGNCCRKLPFVKDAGVLVYEGSDIYGSEVILWTLLWFFSNLFMQLIANKSDYLIVHKCVIIPRTYRRTVFLYDLKIMIHYPINSSLIQTF
ncbi:hypothetical protein SRCM101294_01867 [Bacillus amyloliquefaciens]|nr:hypothetical protein SRCM101294_01867 [Bacillus amyloliquefaciens]